MRISYWSSDVCSSDLVGRDQRGGGDLVPAEAVGVHQEEIRPVRQPRADVVGDDPVPVEMVAEPKGGGEGHAQIPFRIRAVVEEGGDRKSVEKGKRVS